MKKYMIALFSSFIVCNIYSASFFLCTDGPLRIRAEPSLTSNQIGTLQLFDMVEITGKTSEKSTIDTITDYWYKIKKETIEGYVFGGYGIELQERYEIASIDDIIKAFPDKFHADNTNRYIFDSNIGGKYPMIRLDYLLTFMKNNFSLQIYFRPKSEIDINRISKELNLEINTSSNFFGRGDSYKMLKNISNSDSIITNHGSQGRYFFDNWYSDYTYDIANFLFETEFYGIFDGILICSVNSWTNYKDLANINKISNDFIKEARKQKIKESLFFQVLYELILRFDIVNKY